MSICREDSLIGIDFDDSTDFDIPAESSIGTDSTITIWCIQDIDVSCYTNSSGRTCEQKSLQMHSSHGDRSLMCVLRDDWMRMEVAVGDLAYVSCKFELKGNP